MTMKELETIKEAADWLCDAPAGTDQRDRGDALMKIYVKHISLKASNLATEIQQTLTRTKTP